MNDKEFNKYLLKVFKGSDVKYILKGRELGLEEIFSATGLMPAIAKRADQLCSLCLGYGLGASYTEKEASMLGTEVAFDDSTPVAVKLLMIYDVMQELGRGISRDKKISLDELLYD
ncbi:MAG: type IV secretion protein IcmS [Legionellales bacterium]|jgi:intracellular multiplication protein IcmS|nr:type IV secretion protein IcmS [Legionellales bacterium]